MRLLYIASFSPFVLRDLIEEWFASQVVCEIFREPDVGHWATHGWFTAGILYSLPMIAAGLYLLYRVRDKTAA